MWETIGAIALFISVILLANYIFDKIGGYK